MRLRSTCTSHKNSTRRRLRMALAVALSVVPGTALAAEKLPRSLPAPLNHAELDHPEYCDAGLLPYPFGPTGTCAGAKPEAKLERLVALVGLHRAGLHRQNAGQPGSAASYEVGSYEVGRSMLDQVSLPAMHLHALPPQVASAEVVPASGAQPIGPAVGRSTVPALPALALPDTLPAAHVTASAVEGAVEDAVEESDELSPSLIDIAIPPDMMLLSEPPQLGEATAISLESSSLESSPPASLSDPALPASSNTAAAPGDRKPELIQPAKSLSLTTRQPSNSSVSLSLNDTPAAASPASVPAVTAQTTGSAVQRYALSDATLDDIQPGERGVALHLSSASQFPMKAAAMPTSESAQPQFSQPSEGMQVRVEGEPAPMLAARRAGNLSRQAPAAPLPSMASAPRGAPPVRAEVYEPSNKVKAAFATRTSIIPDRDLERTMDTLGRVAKQARESLTVGLQESQNLSAQFVITELSVEHPSICQLMQTGESSVSLVGVRPGSTRIALVMVNDAGERQVEIHEVSVTSAPAAVKGLPDLAVELSRAVGRLVPNSDVEIVAYEDYILVHGFTHYESDAKKILSLVRKTSLVPVVDQLKSNDQ